jgi:hypothetical protein
MSAHTPGPWRVGDAGHTVFGAPDAGRATPDRVATLCQSRFSARGNARLIAAAPDLLDALNAVYADTEVWPSDELRILVEAAIAKAEGQAP